MPARTSSSGVTFSSSSSGRPASTVTSAVISFVIEAIGSTAWTFFSNSTSLVSWSTTSATWLFNCSGSPLCERPASWPSDGRSGARSARTLRLDWRRADWAGMVPFTRWADFALATVVEACD